MCEIEWVWCEVWDYVLCYVVVCEVVDCWVVCVFVDVGMVCECVGLCDVVVCCVEDVDFCFFVWMYVVDEFGVG